MCDRVGLAQEPGHRHKVGSLESHLWHAWHTALGSNTGMQAAMFVALSLYGSVFRLVAYMNQTLLYF